MLKRNIKTIIKKYKDRLEQKNYSQITIKNNVKEVENFFEFLNQLDSVNNYYITLGRGSILKFYYEDLIIYNMFLMNQYQQNTRIKKMSAIRSFIEYLQDLSEFSYLKEMNMVIIEKKNQVKSKDILTNEDVKLLLNVTKNYTDFFTMQDYIILSLFLTNGMRVSSLLNIKISDIKLNEKYFTSVGKCNNEIVHYITEKLYPVFVEYLKIRESFNVKTEYLIINKKYEKMKYESVRKIIIKIYKKANVKIPKMPIHIFRHTCATKIYLSTIEENKKKYNSKESERKISLDAYDTVSKLLGHRNRESTAIYIHSYRKSHGDVSIY